MGRPPKLQRVDYFPHMCIHKKTMYIIEQQYGNDGYSFWFKLLEQLGAENGHALDMKNIPTWEFCQARARLSSERCREILDRLAHLDAIDRELWENAQIVWSQNFVDNLADIYRKRNTPLPERPTVSGAESTGQDGFPAQKLDQTWVSGAESAARIGQDRRGEERKEPETAPEIPETPEPENQTPKAEPISRRDQIAQEKSGTAWEVLIQTVGLHVRDGTRLAITDHISREVFMDLGGVEAFRGPVQSGNGTLAAMQKAFRDRYERREVREFARNRSG